MVHTQSVESQNKQQIFEEGDSLILGGDEYIVVESTASEIVVVLDALLKEVFEENEEEIAMERAEETIRNDFKYFFGDKKELTFQDIKKYQGALTEEVEHIFWLATLDEDDENKQKMSREELEENIIEKMAEILKGEVIEELKNEKEKMGDTSIFIDNKEYRYFNFSTETLSLPLDIDEQ